MAILKSGHPHIRPSSNQAFCDKVIVSDMSMLLCNTTPVLETAESNGELQIYPPTTHTAESTIVIGGLIECSPMHAQGSEPRGCPDVASDTLGLSSMFSYDTQL